MLYEIILKQRWNRNPYEVKYKCVVPEKALKQTYRKYVKEAVLMEQEEKCDCVVLVNELYDNGEFNQIMTEEELMNL